MKKFLTALAIITVVCASAPAFAAPPPPPNYHSHYIHAGYRPDMRRPYYQHGYHRPYNSFSVYTNHRLAFPYCRCPHCMAHRPQSGIGFYFSF